MKRWLPLGLTLVFLCGVSGCKAKHEAISADYLAIMNELCDVMDGVTDEASAQAAVPKVEKLGTRMNELVDRFNTGGLPEPAEAQRLAEKYNPQQEKVVQRMSSIPEKLKKYPALAQAYNKHFTVANLRLKFVPVGSARFEGVGSSQPRR